MNNSEPQVLILGVGNLLLSDEGFGVHVIRLLQERFAFPSNVALYDGGTGGLSLLSQIKDKDYLFIIDAVLMGEEPGTICQFRHDAVPHTYQRKDTAHGIDVLDVLAAAALRDSLPTTTIIGIQPEDISTPGLELSSRVSQNMETLVQTLLAELDHLGISIGEKRHLT